MVFFKKASLGIFLFFVLSSVLIVGCGSSEPKTAEAVDTVIVESKETVEAFEPDFQMMQIAGKTKANVDAVLGNPTEYGALDNGTYKLLSGERIPAEKGVYSAGDFELEVAYLDDTAQLITVYPPAEKYIFPNDIVTLFGKTGMPYSAPTIEKSIFSRWENSIPGIYEVSIFSEDSNVSFLYVIVSDKYK